MQAKPDLQPLKQVHFYLISTDASASPCFFDPEQLGFRVVRPIGGGNFAAAQRRFDAQPRQALRLTLGT